MASYCVLIGDIKKSRDIEDVGWATLFRTLEATLSELNTRFSTDIQVPFKPTVGDEFQGVLKSPKNAYASYLFIQSHMQVDFYCGLGIGEIEIPVANAVGMRGTAFYRARSALETCKKRKRKVLIKSADGPDLTDEILNTVLHLLEVLEESWTARQREVVTYVRLHPGATYEQIGHQFAISKQAVSQILAAADWAAVSEGEELVHRLLRHLARNPPLPIEIK